MIIRDADYEDNIGQYFNLSSCKINGVTESALMAQINPNSIDLTIDAEYKRPNKIKNGVQYGFSCEKEATLYSTAYWKTEVSMNGEIVMKPGDVILACTRETVKMPNNICGQLFTKSTLGRMFVNHMMAGVIDAGYEGRLTLELKNEGVHTVRIPVGSRIVQLICYKLDGDVRTPYGSKRKSRYQNATVVECAKWSISESGENNDC